MEAADKKVLERTMRKTVEAELTEKHSAIRKQLTVQVSDLQQQADYLTQKHERELDTLQKTLTK